MPTARLPFLWGSVYAPPNPDGSQKKCGNCYMFVQEDQRCVIHEPSIRITAGFVCGYHLFGEPISPEGAGYISVLPISPELSGLADLTALDGSSCSTCRFYESKGKTKGLCHGLANADNGKPPQDVQSLGCCARWEINPTLVQEG